MSGFLGTLGAHKASSNFKKSRDDRKGIGPVCIDDELAAEAAAANIIAAPPSKRSQEDIEQLIQTLLVFPFFGQLPEANLYLFSKHATLAEIGSGQEIRFHRNSPTTLLKPASPSESRHLSKIEHAPATPMRRLWLFLLRGTVSMYALKDNSEADGSFAAAVSKTLLGSFSAGDCIAIDPHDPSPSYTEADSLTSILIVPESSFGNLAHLITAYSSLRAFFCSRPCDRSLNQIQLRHKELLRAFPHSEFLKDLSPEDALSVLRYAQWHRPKPFVPVLTQGEANNAAFFILSGTVEYFHQPQGTEVDLQGFIAGTATLKKASAHSLFLAFPIQITPKLGFRQIVEQTAHLRRCGG
jgi:hypothetical protein